jgi:hypothetical protein
MEALVTIFGIIYMLVLPVPVLIVVVGLTDQRKYKRWWAVFVSWTLILHSYHVLYHFAVISDLDGGSGGRGNLYALIMMSFAYMFMLIQLTLNKKDSQ